MSINAEQTQVLDQESEARGGGWNLQDQVRGKSTPPPTPSMGQQTRGCPAVEWCRVGRDGPREGQAGSPGPAHTFPILAPLSPGPKQFRFSGQ